MKPVRAAVIFLLLVAPLSVLAQTKEAERIKIVSNWGGLGESEHGELTIKRKSGGYFRDGRKVEDGLIRDLIAAVNEPVVLKPESSNLGITQQWLEANAEEGAKEYAEWYFSAAAPNQRDLYFSSLRDRAFVEKVIQSLFSFVRSDDYPHVEVTIMGAGGAQVTVASASQYLFMLPWKVTKDGRTAETYNAHISRAVAGLLPEKFANRGRIAGEGLRRDLAEAVMRWIEDDWNLLETENKAGEYLAPLRSRFTVETAEINGNHNVEYGKEWVNGNPAETNLHATLRRNDFPNNFFIGAVLPYKNNRVENVDLFLNGIERYRNLTLSVPWLSEYIASHPRVDVELRFVGDRSFGEKAMRIFTDDMRQIGKEALADEVAAIQKDVSLLRVGRKYSQAHWLVLPDGRMILWRFIGYDALLKWKAAEFTHHECSRYQAKCVGAVISPDGAIISK
jgi:hypothetical protein